MKDLEKTIVVFRKFKDHGDVIALFPYEPWSSDGSDCASYQHIGQHGSASYTHCIQISKPAIESEYKALKNELESIGYNLVVRKKLIKSRKA